MKFFLIFLIIVFKFNNILAQELIFFLDSAYKNNPQLKAERENLKAKKENINISRSEFLPSISLSGSIESSQSTNRTDNTGAGLSDTNQDKETQTISVDQKIFQGFEGYNSLKKSQLEFNRANFVLKNAEQASERNKSNIKDLFGEDIVISPKEDKDIEVEFDEVAAEWNALGFYLDSHPLENKRKEVRIW